MNRTNLQWELDEFERAALLEQFPPIWPDIYAYHVTCGWNDQVCLQDVETGRIVGIVDDGKGLQALVVEIGVARNWVLLRFPDVEIAVIEVRAAQRSTNRAGWIKALVRRHVALKSRVDDGLPAELAPLYDLLSTIV